MTADGVTLWRGTELFGILVVINESASGLPELVLFDTAAQMLPPPPADGDIVLSRHRASETARVVRATMFGTAPSVTATLEAVLAIHTAGPVNPAPFRETCEWCDNYWPDCIC